MLLGQTMSGCLDLKQPPVTIAYYTLEYTAPEIKDSPALPVVLRIAPIRAATPYRSTQMVVRSAPFKRDAFIYHRWHTDPGNMITENLINDLKQSALFQAVLPVDSYHSGKYLLEGTVDEFYVQEESGSWQAVLSLTLTLMATTEGTIVWQQQVRASGPCLSKTPQGIAQAMSTAMQTLSAEIITTLYEHLR